MQTKAVEGLRGALLRGRSIDRYNARCFHREDISFDQIRLIAVVEPLLYTTKG